MNRVLYIPYESPADARARQDNGLNDNIYFSFSLHSGSKSGISWLETYNKHKKHIFSFCAAAHRQLSLL